MVILVDDEDERDGECKQIPHDTHSVSQWDSDLAEALPWDEKRQKASSSAISTGIWADTAESQQSDEIGRLKTRRPMFRQPSEAGSPAQQPIAVGSGSKTGGRAFSVTSNSDQRMSIDEEKRTSIGGADNRPSSQGSIFVPIQTTMQPKVKIAGRPSFDGDVARKAPINMPGRSEGERETSMDGRPSARRTYKSLSPYGILFED